MEKKKKKASGGQSGGLFWSNPCCDCVSRVFAVDVFDMDEWHDFEPELILDSKKSLMVYDKNGGEASLLYSKENRQWIGIDEIPMHVRYAFISAEDARFYEHGGVDIIRIFGAALHDLKVGSLNRGRQR